jgi:hypothetical protein
MYIVGSTKYESEVESLIFLIFVMIGVALDLYSIILNLIGPLIPRVHAASILHLELSCQLPLSLE